ncbi:ATP cone domain-containing protein [Flavobacterium chuncheonense]|uniref:ATP cone domain-containing protein n=1 Tax=Flavobacterium chuncheonense TaxID=2026653 RepID=A0ABW5YKY5_9FLAO
MKVKKNSGEVVAFNKEKLIRSLLASGATLDKANDIIDDIESQFYDGITSRKIYRLAFQKLKSSSKAHAARYSLKKGIMALGPAGFHFEKFIARIFELQGCQSQTNIVVEGSCTSHELDVVIKKDNHIAMIECKFHGSQETKTDVKVPMYILSRFNDVKGNTYNFFGDKNQISKCWLVTNNRFTSEAIKFGTCSNLNLMSWDYPPQSGLKDLVSKYNVYPITCLTTLTMAEKEILLLQNILTVYNLLHNKDGFAKLKLSQSRVKNVMKECEEILNH